MASSAARDCSSAASSASPGTSIGSPIAIATSANGFGICVRSQLRSVQWRLASMWNGTMGLPVALAAGQTWTLQGRIERLPLVEGEYRFGLYVVGGGFQGNLTDLIELTVGARSTRGDVAPYPAVHRGVVELDFKVEPIAR